MLFVCQSNERCLYPSGVLIDKKNVLYVGGSTFTSGERRLAKNGMCGFGKKLFILVRRRQGRGKSPLRTRLFWSTALRRTAPTPLKRWGHVSGSRSHRRDVEGESSSAPAPPPQPVIRRCHPQHQNLCWDTQCHSPQDTIAVAFDILWHLLYQGCADGPWLLSAAQLQFSMWSQASCEAEDIVSFGRDCVHLQLTFLF